MRFWQLCFVTLMLISACSSDPTGPALPPAHPPISDMLVTDADELAVMVDDLLERILPSLADGSLLQELGASLRELRASLIDGHAVGVRNALVQARLATTRYTGYHDSAMSEAELDALRLALDLVALQLNDPGLAIAWVPLITP